MAKSLLELVAELTDIREKQRDLSNKESQILIDISKFDSSSRPHIAETAIIPTSNGVTVNTSQPWNATLKIDKKAANILRRTKRIMTNREVSDAIVEIEKNSDPDYIRLLIRKFSAIVGSKAKIGRTFKRIEIDGDLYYGLVDWFEANGSVKPEYGQIE